MRLAIGLGIVLAVLIVIFRQDPVQPAPANVSTDNRIQLEKMGAVRWKRSE